MAMTKVSVRPLREDDLPQADRILRAAFDRFTGAENLFGDKDYAGTRWRADPDHAVVAESEGQIVGSNFVTLWGSLGFFGPLSVDPPLWDRGIAKGLMETTMDLFAAAQTGQAGLFTFPQSAKHVGLYQRFGFWPQGLTPVLQWPVPPAASRPAGCERFSELTADARAEALRDCREVAGSILDGLDVTREILAVAEQGLGDTILLHEERLEGFAVCHAGAGSEAGSGLCYVKFAALRAGSGVRQFDRLLEGCTALAASLGASRVEAGVNTGCHEAYRRLLERGARGGFIGVAMIRPNATAYNRPGTWVLSDWR